MKTEEAIPNGKSKHTGNVVDRQSENKTKPTQHKKSKKMSNKDPNKKVGMKNGMSPETDSQNAGVDMKLVLSTI